MYSACNLILMVSMVFVYGNDLSLCTRFSVDVDKFWKHPDWFRDTEGPQYTGCALCSFVCLFISVSSLLGNTMITR